MAPQKVNTALLLLAVCAPAFFGICLEDGPRVYYVAQGLLVAFLLSVLWVAYRGPVRIVCGLGVALQLAYSGCGIWAESGACVEPGQPSVFLLVVLFAITTTASIVGNKNG